MALTACKINSFFFRIFSLILELLAIPRIKPDVALVLPEEGEEKNDLAIRERSLTSKEVEDLTGVGIRHPGSLSKLGYHISASSVVPFWFMNFRGCPDTYNSLVSQLRKGTGMPYSNPGEIFHFFGCKRSFPNGLFFRIYRDCPALSIPFNFSKLCRQFFTFFLISLGIAPSQSNR